MNEIEKLNERISQLTELVKSGEETISATKEMLKLAEQERDRLADQRRESEPKFERVKHGEYYWSVSLRLFCNEGKARACRHDENYDRIDYSFFDNNNYFKTEQRAQEVADKINLLLRLERLHDTFCPDFNLGLGDELNTEKYYVFYSFIRMKWAVSWTIEARDAVQVYFPTEEIAQKVCDILNAEGRSKDV